GASLDHLVGAGEQHRRHVDAEQLRRLLVEDEFELGRLHDWQIGRFCPLEDSADIDADLTIAVGNARAIAHQAADIDKFAYWSRFASPDGLIGRGELRKKHRDRQTGRRAVPAGRRQRRCRSLDWYWRYGLRFAVRGRGQPALYPREWMLCSPCWPD